MQMYLLYFVFKCVHFPQRYPTLGGWWTSVGASWACTESTVNQLERIITIHGSQKAKLEWRFVFYLVKTRRAHILCLPWVGASKCMGDGLVNSSENFEIAVISVAELICQIGFVRYLQESIKITLNNIYNSLNDNDSKLSRKCQDWNGEIHAITDGRKLVFQLKTQAWAVRAMLVLPQIRQGWRQKTLHWAYGKRYVYLNLSRRQFLSQK